MARFHRIVAVAIVGLPAIFTTSCPTPFRDGEISLLRDTQSPEITITTPIQGSTFESTVTISGTVHDRDDSGAVRAGASTDYIATCSWDILDSDPTETPVEVAADGSFSFTFPSAELTGQITVVVSAEDVNGNTASTSLVLAADEDGPFVAITSPEDYGEYATLLTLAGTVTNGIDDTTTTEVDPAVSYRIPGTALIGTTTIDAGTGAFATALDVASLDGTRTIEVTATDLNGNETTAVVTIVKPADGGDISGFTVTPGNKQVTIEWDEVPGAEEYTLYESNYAQTVIDATSPYIWEGLENGEVYQFQLQAIVPEEMGADAWSNEAEVIPLSDRTLAPWIEEIGSRSITVVWNSEPNISRYTLEKRKGTEPWTVAVITSQNRYVDTRLDPESVYQYRVYPNSQDDVISQTAASRPGAFGPGISGNYATLGSANDVVLSGDYLYVADGNAGLSIFDISEPDAPVRIATRAVAGTARSVAVSGGYAYIADGEPHLAIIDVSTPSSPGVPSYVSLSDDSYDVDIDETYVYVAIGESGLAIIDISIPGNPGTPMYRQTDDGDDPFQQSIGVIVLGNYAYVMKGDVGIAAVDVSNPAAGTYFSTGEAGDAQDMVVVGEYAYVAGGDQEILAVFDMTDPSEPTPITTFDLGLPAEGISVDGDELYVSSGSSGFSVVDISNRVDPRIVQTISTEGRAGRMVQADRGVYLADGPGGLTTIDVANADDYGSDIFISGSSDGRRVVTDGYYAYVADGGSGLRIFDITEPTVAYRVHTESAGFCSGVAASGNYVYFTAGPDLAIMDVTDPANPGTPVLATTAGNPVDVVVAGSHAYVADSVAGLTIIDISDPTQPGAPYSVSISAGAASAIAIADNYAFLTDDQDGLTAIDISDPTDPGSPIEILTSIEANDVDVANGTAYVAAQTGGDLIVIDVSDPSSPGSPIPLDTVTSVMGVAVAGRYAFVTNLDGGLTLVEVSNPLDPAPFVDVNRSGYALGIAVSGRYVFVADNWAGFYVVDFLGAVE